MEGLAALTQRVQQLQSQLGLNPPASAVRPAQTPATGQPTTPAGSAGSAAGPLGQRSTLAGTVQPGFADFLAEALSQRSSAGSGLSSWGLDSSGSSLSSFGLNGFASNFPSSGLDSLGPDLSWLGLDGLGSDLSALLGASSPSLSSLGLGSVSANPLNLCPDCQARLRAAQSRQVASTAQTENNIVPLVQTASQHFGVDPALILAVIKAESGFNPNAVSPVGAKGLMQLMDGTARRLGVTDSFDPAQNVAAGTQFLAELLQRYKGDVEKVLAAYNAGPGAVDRYGGVPPYEETMTYVPRVLGYLRDYQQQGV